MLGHRHTSCPQLLALGHYCVQCTVRSCRYLVPSVLHNVGAIIHSYSTSTPGQCSNAALSRASVALDLWLNHGVFTGERRSADPGRYHATTTMQMGYVCDTCMHGGCRHSRSADLAPARTHAFGSSPQIYVPSRRTPGLAGWEGQGSVVIGRSKPTRCLLADRSARV